MTGKKGKIAAYIHLLKSFPPHGKNKRRRKAYLRVHFLENRKVFFDIFCQKVLTKKYNTRDKERILKGVSLLPEIFQNIPPEVIEGNKYLFRYTKKGEPWIAIVKESNGLHLLSLYPDTKKPG